MPGPFPGMDPYLEDPNTWTGTHNRLITQLDTLLNALLPLPYAAYTEARCYIERREEMRLPDLAILSVRPFIPEYRGGSTIVAAPSDPPLHVHLSTEEQRECYIDIRDVKNDQKVITTIELLSPVNKTTPNRGYRLYRQKQQEVLGSSTHLIEIDLLRAGKHTVAVPETALPSQPHYDYLVCQHPAGAGDVYDVWKFSLRERLPRITVPLEEGVPDVILDLQAAFDMNFDTGAYLRKIDYRREPIPPLTGDDAVWADALLREKGLR